VYFSLASGPAVLSGNLVTLLGSGNVVVNAWQPGDSNYNAAATVQQSFGVAAIPQTINFGVLSQQHLGDSPFSLSASSSSSLLVRFSVVSGPASISGNMLTITGAGTVTIRASQDGDGIYGAAPDIDQSFSVLPAASGGDTNGGDVPTMPEWALIGLAVAVAALGLRHLAPWRAKRRECR
jgi:hypothetical protein